MKLEIKQDPAQHETEIVIRCREIDDRLQALIRQIQVYAFSVSAHKDGRNYTLPLDSIFYFESVDDKTFAYTADNVYESAARLYELEQQLDNTPFLRVSKSCILNTNRVESVRPLLDRRMEARLENGEKLHISRHYMPAFEAEFLGEGRV